MIIPTAEFDPLFADDGVPFQTKMVQYIQREFEDILGGRRQLLQSEQGLDAFSNIVAEQLADEASTRAA